MLWYMKVPKIRQCVLNAPYDGRRNHGVKFSYPCLLSNDLVVFKVGRSLDSEHRDGFSMT